MPSRVVSLLIILFWLGTTSWFVHRELWPLFFPNDAPPFLIELDDEITSQFSGESRRSDAFWDIQRNEERIGFGESRLRYVKEVDLFEMETRIRELRLKGFVRVEMSDLISSYRVNRQGELRGLRMSGHMTLHVLGMSLSGSMDLVGEVKDGKLIRSGVLDLPGLGKINPKFDVIDAPRGSFLNPMHPVPKVRVRPGHRWRMPVMDPLTDALEPILQSIVEQVRPDQPIDWKKLLPPRPSFMDAEVLQELVTIEYYKEKVPCYVIEFRSEGRIARTYVRESDGAVMRQEVFSQGERIALIRL
jgi:hypothetical protein